MSKNEMAIQFNVKLVCGECGLRSKFSQLVLIRLSFHFATRLDSHSSPSHFEIPENDSHLVYKLITRQSTYFNRYQKYVFSLM